MKVLCFFSMFCYAVQSPFLICNQLNNLMWKRGGAGCLLFFLSSCCLVTVNVLCLLVTVAWVGLQCVIVVFPDHSRSVLFLKINLAF